MIILARNDKLINEIPECARSCFGEFQKIGNKEKNVKKINNGVRGRRCCDEKYNKKYICISFAHIIETFGLTIFKIY